MTDPQPITAITGHGSALAPVSWNTLKALIELVFFPGPNGRQRKITPLQRQTYSPLFVIHVISRA